MDNRPAVTIINIKKIANNTHISNTGRHNGRENKADEDTSIRENIDWDRTYLNCVLVYPTMPVLSLVHKKTKEVKGALDKKLKPGVVRITSIKAVEFTYSTSPRYFKPIMGKETMGHGRWDQGKTEAWIETVLTHLKKKWGNAIIRMDLHLDEVSPHIHCIVCGTANCAPELPRYNANRNFLKTHHKEAYHDRYAEVAKHLGIVRATKGGRRKPLPEKEYMHIIRGARSLVKRLPPITVPYVPKPSSLMRLTNSPGAKKINIQRAKRAEQIKAFRKAEKHNAKLTLAAVAEVEVEKSRVNQLTKANSQLSQELKKLKPIARAVRDLDTKKIMLDWQDATGKKLPKGAEQARNAIDLTKLLESCDYKKAVLILAQNYGTQGAVSSAAKYKVDETKKNIPTFIHNTSSPSTHSWSEQAKIRKMDKKREALSPLDKFKLWLHEQGYLSTFVPNERPEMLSNLLNKLSSIDEIRTYALGELSIICGDCGVDLLALRSCNINLILNDVLKTKGMSPERINCLNPSPKIKTEEWDKPVPPKLQKSLDERQKNVGKIMHDSTQVSNTIAPS